MKRNTYKSFQWSLFTALFRKLILFGVFLLIAKEIGKEDLGIFREFSLVIAIFASISFFGFKDLLIVKKESTKSLFQELLQFSIIIALFSSLALFLLGPRIGQYYKSSLLGDLLVSLSPLIGLEIFRLALRSYYQKKLRFKALAIIETVNVLVYSALIILFLFISLDIKSLIIIFYFGNLVELILLLAMESSLMKETLGKVFSFSLLKDFALSYKRNKKFLLTASSNNLLSMLINDLPVIVLGILFNPALIGLYYLANQLIGQPVVLACNSLGQVLFPTFTLMTKAEIRERIAKFFRIVTLLAFPLFFLFVIYVENLVPLVLGDKWNQALPIVSILAFSLATTMLMNPISSLPYVFQLPHIEMIFMIINLSIKSLAIYLGHTAGFETALLYYVIASMLIHLVFISLVTKLLEGSIVKSLVSILIKSIPTLLLILIYQLLGDWTSFYKLLLLSILILLYLIIAKRLGAFNK